jgi:dihydrolipoamide dehydrogenase
VHASLVVLGGGPGGYAAAFYAADKGLDVVLVEAETQLGGTCLLRGCIPSKALLHVARVIGEVEELQHDWGIQFGGPQIALDRLRQRKDKVISTLSTGLKQLAKRRGVTIVHARGSLESSSRLRLAGDDPSIPDDRILSFDHLILATGSLPAVPGTLASESARVIDSAGALALESIPSSLLVIGGGYIGLEMATVYARLGSQVSIVELTDTLLPGADRDLIKPLAQQMARLVADRIYLDTKVGSLGEVGDAVEVAFEGPGKFGVERFERVLVAVGRRPASQGLGLDKTDVRLNERGFVVCDRHQRTNDARILAIGDVAGEPMLAHKASHEARVAVETILGGSAEFAPAAIPAVVFTDPEVAWAGIMEEAAKRDGRPYEVATYPWAASGRAQSLGRVEGLTKWIIDAETEIVIGCGICGPNAGELIGEAVLAIEMACEVSDLAGSIHAHPTLSETLMNAAEVYFGTATEIFKPRRKGEKSARPT